MNHDDPRLTHHVLGEEKSAEMTEALNNDPALQQEAEALQATAERMARAKARPKAQRPARPKAQGPAQGPRLGQTRHASTCPGLRKRSMGVRKSALHVPPRKKGPLVR